MKKVRMKDANIIAKKLGLKGYPPKLWQYAMQVEMEHGLYDKRTNVTNNDLLKTGKIALAHILEFPDYYERLKKMEKEAARYWGS